MNSFLALFVGEVQRMQKYHILTASVFVSFFWIGMVHLLDVPDITFLFLMVVFFDLVSMSILMVGVTIFFEKQEGVLKSLIVSPISKIEFLSAKTIGNLVSNIVTISIVYIYAAIFQEINISIIGLLGTFLLVGVFHTLVGILLIYRSRDFTELLVKMMSYFLLFMIPVLFEQLNLITSRIYSYAVYIIPTKSAATMLEAVAGNVELWEILLSVFYLSIGSVILGYFVIKKFKDFAIRESGV